MKLHWLEATLAQVTRPALDYLFNPLYMDGEAGGAL